MNPNDPIKKAEKDKRKKQMTGHHLILGKLTDFITGKLLKTPMTSATGKNRKISGK